MLALESKRGERRERRVQIPGAVSPRSEGAFILPAAGKVYKFELLIAGLPTQQQQAQARNFSGAQNLPVRLARDASPSTTRFFFQKHFFYF